MSEYDVTGKRLSPIKPFRKDLRTSYCPPGYWVPAALFVICALSAVALLASAALLPVARIWLVELIFKPSNAKIRIAILGSCVEAGNTNLYQTLFNATGDVDLPQADRNALNRAIIGQLTYTFIFHEIAAIAAVFATLLLGIGYLMRWQCFCCFGRGNVPAFGCATLATLSMLTAFAFDAALLIYAHIHRNSTLINVNIFSAAIIFAAAILLFAAWIAILIYFLRTRHIMPDALQADTFWRDDDNESEFIQDREFDASTTVSDQAPPQNHQHLIDTPQPHNYQMPVALVAPKAQFMLSPTPRYPPRLPSIRIDVASPEPMSRPTSFDRPRPTAALMYSQKPVRASFRPPPTAAPSSAYSQSTHHPPSAEASGDSLKVPKMPSALAQAKARMALADVRSSVYSTATTAVH